VCRGQKLLTLKTDHMKKVFTADAGEFGVGFTIICDSLDELRRVITKWYYPERKYSMVLYREAKKKGMFILYEIDLHDDEQILFDDYDGCTTHYIAKKKVDILSTSTQLSPYA
jgi:hypothetical protein